MNKEEAKKLPKKINNSLVDTLSPYLKDPANYEEVQRQVVASVQTTCSHSDLLEYSKCPRCTEKMLERRKLLKKLGFKNPRQYMEWRKIHHEIKRRFPLVDWKKKKLLDVKDMV